jgi:hypothetical protein
MRHALSGRIEDPSPKLLYCLILIVMPMSSLSQVAQVKSGPTAEKHAVVMLALAFHDTTTLVPSNNSSMQVSVASPWQRLAASLVA